MPLVTFDLSKIREVINPSFYNLLWDQSDYSVFRGGAGSGKSYFIIQKLLFRILIDYNNGFKHRFLCLKRTAPYARKSLFPLIRDMLITWGLSPFCIINKTHMTFTFSNGSEIIVMGLDDPEKVKSIDGVTTISMEECTEFGLEDMMQLSLRMRGQFPSYYQMILAFNPISKHSWVYKEFYQDPERYGDEAMLHLSTYKDNMYLDEAYKKKLNALAERDHQWYKVYCLGSWGSLENVIYKNYDSVIGFPTDLTDITLGLDFGFVHPNSLVAIGVPKDDTNDVFVKELLYKKKQTTTRLIESMLKLIPKSGSEQINMSLPIYCDNARPEAIKQLKEAGFNAMRVKKGKNSVIEGINTVKSCDLRIERGSKNILKEISAYKWREDKSGNVFEEPFKHQDDAMDALRYAIYSRFRQRKEVGVIFASE